MIKVEKHACELEEESSKDESEKTTSTTNSSSSSQLASKQASNQSVKTRCRREDMQAEKRCCGGESRIVKNKNQNNSI